jgi:hypothetical protein
VGHVSASDKTSASAFSPVTMIIMVLVGVVCLAGISLISAFEPELKSGNDGQAHAMSKSSVGYFALTRILEDAGYDVDRNRAGILDDVNAYSTVLLTPKLGTASETLLDFFREGPTVIILPKWYVRPDRENRGWMKLAIAMPTSEVFDILPADLQKDSKLDETDKLMPVSLTIKSATTEGVDSYGSTKPITSLRTLSGPQWIPLVAGPNGGAVIAKKKDLNVYVIADPDILNNAAMSNFGTVDMLETFLLDIASEEDEGPIVFDLTLNGFQKKPNIGRLLIQPPLLGATLCFVLTAILIALQAATRFLPPKEATRVVALGKKALADNTAGLIRMGRREHRMSLPYANMMKRIVMKAVGAPASLDPAAQTAMLDRVSELSNSNLRFSTLVGEAGSASNPTDLVKIASELHRWKQETTRERQ